MAPKGCKAWISPLNKLRAECILHIRCHDVCNFRKATRATIKRLTRIVTKWLKPFGLSLDDFRMKRIDYDFNAVIPEYSEAIMDALGRGKRRTAYMEKKAIDGGYRYGNKSRAIQWYDKEAERLAKTGTVTRKDRDIHREEGQFCKPFLRYMEKKYGILRTWSNWVSVEQEAFFLEKHRKLFPRGKFCTVAKAKSLIEKSSLSPTMQKRIVEALVVIRQEGMDALEISRNTLNKYVEELEKLDICPLPLSEEYGVDMLDNPFHKTPASKRRKAHK